MVWRLLNGNHANNIEFRNSKFRITLHLRPHDEGRQACRESARWRCAFGLASLALGCLLAVRESGPPVSLDCETRCPSLRKPVRRRRDDLLGHLLDRRSGLQGNRQETFDQLGGNRVKDTKLAVETTCDDMMAVGMKRNSKDCPHVSF